MELSIWEKTSLINYDFVVVGAGITGLSTALSIKESNPTASVLVLEKGLLPTGASTKNAGFACFGSLTEVLSDINQIGAEASAALVKKRWMGLEKVRQRTAGRNIGYLNQGGYELLEENQLKCLDELDAVNALLKPAFGTKVYTATPEKIQLFGFDDTRVAGLITNSLEGQLDTGLLMKTLHQMAMEAGVVVMTGAEVLGFEDLDDRVEVKVQNGTQTMIFCAQKLAICNNAFAADLIPGLDLKPGRGQVLVTKPIKNLKFKGTFHIEEGYYYFRDYGDRVVFGGGRHKAFEEETTTVLGTNDFIRQHLEELLSQVVMPGQSVDSDYFWSGIMAFGASKEPIIRSLSKNVVAGVRLGGMGVAIGSLVGDMVANQLIRG